jgi:hypothetical protein
MLTALGIAFALAGGALLLWFGRHPPQLGHRRGRRLAARGVQMLYVVAGVSLLVRGAMALTTVSG